jgi:hypothetical protein
LTGEPVPEALKIGFLLTRGYHTPFLDNLILIANDYSTFDFSKETTIATFHLNQLVFFFSFPLSMGNECTIRMLEDA